MQFEIRESYLPLWEKKGRYIVLMGGRGAGRSTAGSQYVVSKLPVKDYFRCALMRAIHSDIRHSSWHEVIDRIEEQEVRSAFKLTENDMHIGYGRNSIQAHGFRASSGAHSAKLKSLASYNTVWIEEAEEIGEKEFITLDDTLRTKRGDIKIILTLNTPSKNHWIIKKWFDLESTEVESFYKPKVREGIIYIPGTFRDNLPNLDDHTISRYQRYKIDNPAYYWQYIEGLSPEVVLGKIYSGWQVIDSIPHEARLIGHALDFGFDPDPAAIISIYYFNGGYILDEKLYQTRLLNEHLAIFLKSLPQAPIIADSAEEKAIEDIKRYGLNIIGAEKGPGSVKAGIKEVQSLKISYTRSSVNIQNEYENYAWKINKDGDNLGIEDPNSENHLLSATRYGLTTLVPKVERVDKRKILRELGKRQWENQNNPMTANPV